MIKKVFHNFLITYKNGWENVLSKKRDVILYRAKDYYENDKKRLRDQARDTENYLKNKKIKRNNT